MDGLVLQYGRHRETACRNSRHFLVRTEVRLANHWRLFAYFGGIKVITTCRFAERQSAACCISHHIDVDRLGGVGKSLGHLHPVHFLSRRPVQIGGGGLVIAHQVTVAALEHPYLERVDPALRIRRFHLADVAAGDDGPVRGIDIDLQVAVLLGTVTALIATVACCQEHGHQQEHPSVYRLNFQFSILMFHIESAHARQNWSELHSALAYSQTSSLKSQFSIFNSHSGTLVGVDCIQLGTSLMPISSRGSSRSGR